MVEHMQDLFVPRNCAGVFSILSLSPHNHFVRKRLLDPFFICATERLKFMSHVMEEALVSNLDVPALQSFTPPTSFPTRERRRSFPSGMEVGPRWRGTGVRDTN